MSRVQTQDSVLAKLQPSEAAKVPAKVEPEAEPSKNEGDKPKKTASERIRELVTRSREAEAKAATEAQRATDLEARVQALTAAAKPIEAGAKPLRSQFPTDDDYIEALSDFKARQAIANREREEAEAHADAEAAEIAAQWSKRQDSAMKVFPDYAEVIGKSELQIPPHVHQAILESDQGPQIAYYLALHPEEAKRVAQMKPIQAIKRIASLERSLADIEEEPEKPAKAEVTPSLPQKSKAPAPIEPVKSVPSSAPASASSFEEYKRRRQAGK